MIRFYAAEVGLKYLLSREESVPFEYEVAAGLAPADTSPNPAFIERYSHKLDKMLQRLKVSPSRVSIPPGPFKVVAGYNEGAGGQEFPLGDSHSAWRYGLQVDSADQATLETFLDEVIEYLSQEIT